MDGLEREKTFSFIGYSWNKSFDIEDFKRNISAIIRTLYDKGYRTLMVSPFSMVEDIVAQEMVKRKNNFPDIKLVILENSNADRSKFTGICDEFIDIDVRATSDNGDNRNVNYDYLIDNSSLLVCYMDSKPKKRALSLEKAIAKDMEIINVFSNMKQ